MGEGEERRWEKRESASLKKPFDTSFANVM